MCNTGFLTTIIATFVTPRVTGNALPMDAIIILCVIAVVFWLMGFLLLGETQSEPLSHGKWRRIKVKKDTTIHIMEEA